MPTWGSRLASLAIGGWEWVRRWSVGVVSAGAIAVLAFVLPTALFGFDRENLVFLAAFPAWIAASWLGGILVSAFANANFEANIQQHGHQILFDLNGRTGGRFPDAAKARCFIRDPNGAETVTESVMSNLFRPRYPSDFPDAPPVIAGVYRVTWMLERKPGKWRVVLSKRYQAQAATA